MHLGLFSYALLAGLAIALVVAAATDLRRREIDNGLTGAIALGAPLFWLASSLGLVDIALQVLLAAIVFAVLLVAFVGGAMGGGDVKLLTALALWVEPARFSRLVLLMALIGGVLTLACLARHVIGRRTGAVAVPYGVAISAAALSVLFAQFAPAAMTGTLSW